MAGPKDLCICTFDRNCLTTLHGVVLFILPYLECCISGLLPTSWLHVAQSFQPDKLPLCMVYFEPKHTHELITDSNVLPFFPLPPIYMGRKYFCKT